MYQNITTDTFKDAAVIQAITRMTSLISIVGCSVVAKQCWTLKQQKKLTLMDKLVLVLCLVDLGLAIAWFVGNWSRKDEFACNFQGFWVQFLGLVDILWTDAIAFHIFSLIVLNFTFKKAEKMFKYYLITVITVSLFVAAGLWLKDSYSYTSLWCWTTSYNLKFLYFYSFQIATVVFISYVHLRVSRVIRRDFKTLTNKAYKKDLVHINNKVTQILIIFFVTYFFGLLNRSVEGGTGATNVWTGVMHALLMPLRGFLNSLVYGLRGRKPPLCCLVLARKLPCIGKIFFFEEDLMEDEAEGYGIDLTRLKATYKEAAIFTTTFNLGECDLESLGDLGQWIPAGYDVYVVGLQECLCMEELQAALHKHLGGPKKYTLFKQAIGSKQTKLGFHGMISLSVFARTDEVKNGNFVPYEGANARVVQGVNLGVTKAGNKGAVGMGFRYYDASIAFLTCHFASDSKGKTKLGKRNCDAYNTLREAVLVADNGGFDAHLQHHHTIILGDMNYRIAQPPRLIIEMVAWASIQEKEKSGPAWRSTRYQEFYPSAKTGEIPIYIPEKEGANAKSGWNTLMSFDELSQMLGNSVVFAGFQESRIRFPPSYRRRRGEEGECGDYTDTAKVSGAFTTQIAGEGEAETTGLRPPSYTDRILFHSVEDKEDYLRKGPYELCDAVMGSDHRPVSQSFFLKVNSALWGAASIGDLIPMKLTLDGFKIEFNAAPLPSLFESAEVEGGEEGGAGGEGGMAGALAGVLKQPPWRVGTNGGNSSSSSSSGPKVFREVDIDTITVLFPLPAEDPLTHQRKAAELARALGNDQSDLLSNTKTFDFDKLQRTQGACVEIVGKTRPELGLHALVKFQTVLGEELGQGVIGLPDPGNRILALAVEIPLSVGGTLRGRMTARVVVEQIDFSQALLNGSTSMAGREGGAGGGGGGGGFGLERPAIMSSTAQVVGGDNEGELV